MGVEAGAATREAWAFVQTMLADLTRIVEDDSETELELLEGLRCLARITALCTELTLDADPEHPYFFSMNTQARFVGGPNPDGAYHLGMIDGRRRYRIRGQRGTGCYLGFQIMAGEGMQPRRQAAYVSDRDLALGADGSFELLLATSGAKPSEDELGRATWVEIPEDASGIVVRQYFADAANEVPATYALSTMDPAGSPASPTDAAIAYQLTAMAWTMAKLMTLHRSILPGLSVERPNTLVTAAAASLGSENTTPDNLYMLGAFRLDANEALVIDGTPPVTRYWNLTVENHWHELFDARRRRISVTNAGAVHRADGTVRCVLAASDPGVADVNWLDTGGRHRGFVLFRWLDNPAAPSVTTRVVALDDVKGLA